MKPEYKIIIIPKGLTISCEITGARFDSLVKAKEFIDELNYKTDLILIEGDTYISPRNILLYDIIEIKRRIKNG